MSPLAFLSRPLRWLEAIDRYRGTLSAAPNFAYELCLKRVTDEELAGLDLSSWRVAMNGAEAVMPETLSRFQARFGRCGFASEALMPVYGLAECSVGLTISPLRRGPLVDTIDRELFMSERVAAPVELPTANVLHFVSCGLPLPGHQIRVVDQAERELGERREGRLQFRGPSATLGYLDNPQATHSLFRDGWLESGDRAYIAQGELYLTGRTKDIIIRAGRHIYPEELEAAVGSIQGVRKGCVAVFGSANPTTGTERIIVLAETRAAERENSESIRQQIVQSVVAVIGEPPDEVVLARPHTVPKTSSGKLRRAACRGLFESRGHRMSREHSGQAPLLRLMLGAVVPTAGRVLRRAVEVFYAGYFWVLLALMGSAVYLLVLLPLSRSAVWSIVHHAARAFILLARVPFTVHGCDNINLTRPTIIVANHSSYLDGLFLAAMLPQPCRFVAKRELADTPIAGRFLRRLVTLFVERFDARGRVESARLLAASAGGNASFIFFPEGTFTRSHGLMPFHLGAFSAAAESAAAILPVALRGTRALLRDEQWLPRRTMVIAHIGMPIEPAKGVGSFSSSIHLRDAARRFIREHCNEPDLWAAASHEHMDVDRLRLDPGSMFASPQAVLDHTTLSVGDKIDVLGRWYYDAAEIAVAEEEGMPAHDDDLLRDIVLALEQLTRVDAEHVGPSKQHGLPDLWQDTSSGGPGVSS